MYHFKMAYDTCNLQHMFEVPIKSMVQSTSDRLASVDNNHLLYFYDGLSVVIRSYYNTGTLVA